MTWLFVKGLLKGAWGVLRSIPLWVWVLLALLLTGYLYGEKTRRSGRAEIQANWDRDKARNAVEVSRIVSARGKVTTKIEYRTREVVKEIKVKGDVREKIVTQFVPVDSGYLAGGFRLYYDAAATNTIPDPAEIANATPVAVTDVANTTNANFARCHKAYALVQGWQEWAAEQCAKNPNGCPDGDDK